MRFLDQNVTGYIVYSVVEGAIVDVSVDGALCNSQIVSSEASATEVDGAGASIWDC